jgi:hypothetical protein
MRRQNIFAFRVSNQEKHLISKLARHLQRSQSDAVRFVVIEAEKQLTQVASPAIAVLPAEDLKREQRETYVKD